MRYLPTAVVVIGLVVALSARGAAAQDAAVAASSPAEQFQARYREWSTLDKRLNELRDEYEKAPAASREALKKQYEELVARSSELLPKLGEAAEAAYAAAPNQDADVLRTLVGIMAYDYRHDDCEAALRRAKLMDENKCPEPVVYAIAGAAAFAADDLETAERYLLTADKANKLDSGGKDLLAELPAQK